MYHFLSILSDTLLHNFYPLLFNFEQKFCIFLVYCPVFLNSYYPDKENVGFPQLNGRGNKQTYTIIVSQSIVIVLSGSQQMRSVKKHLHKYCFPFGVTCSFSILLSYLIIPKLPMKVDNFPHPVPIGTLSTQYHCCLYCLPLTLST